MSKSTKKSATAKAAQPVAVVEETEAEAEAAPVAVRVQVKKKDFVEQVVLRSGAKKPVVRDLTEAVLATLGEALARGETLVLPPLGKISVARAVGKAGGEVLHLKLRRMAAAEDVKKDEDFATDPLAETDE